MYKLHNIHPIFPRSELRLVYHPLSLQHCPCTGHRTTPGGNDRAWEHQRKATNHLIPRQERMPPRRRKPPRAGALTELPPLKIIRSILLLQLSYYATAFVLILFTTLVLGQKFTLGLLFDWRSVRGDNTIGWTIGFLWVIDGFITYVTSQLFVQSTPQTDPEAQSNTNPPPYSALQTRPGFCFDHPLSTSSCYIALH